MRSLLIVPYISIFRAGPPLALPFYVGNWGADPAVTVGNRIMLHRCGRTNMLETCE